MSTSVAKSRAYTWRALLTILIGFGTSGCLYAVRGGEIVPSATPLPLTLAADCRAIWPTFMKAVRDSRAFERVVCSESMPEHLRDSVDLDLYKVRSYHEPVLAIPAFLTLGLIPWWSAPEYEVRVEIRLPAAQQQRCRDASGGDSTATALQIAARQRVREMTGPQTLLVLPSRSWRWVDLGPTEYRAVVETLNRRGPELIALARCGR
jgi:hypothetical protein